MIMSEFDNTCKSTERMQEQSSACCIIAINKLNYIDFFMVVLEESKDDTTASFYD